MFQAIECENDLLSVKTNTSLLGSDFKNEKFISTKVWHEVEVVE
jgi:hypothetical protein